VLFFFGTGGIQSRCSSSQPTTNSYSQLSLGFDANAAGLVPADLPSLASWWRPQMHRPDSLDALGANDRLVISAVLSVCRLLAVGMEAYDPQRGQPVAVISAGRSRSIFFLLGPPYPYLLLSTGPSTPSYGEVHPASPRPLRNYFSSLGLPPRANPSST